MSDAADLTDPAHPADPADLTDPADLAHLVARVPSGWTEVVHAGARWGLTRTEHARGGTTTLYAEELGGRGVVSANVWHTAAGDVLRPCEMPAADVLTFLRSWTPRDPEPLPG